MAKIAYPNKQTAVNPSSPAANEIFTAANANEIKVSVNALYDALPGVPYEFTSDSSGEYDFSLVTALPVFIRPSLYLGTIASPGVSQPMPDFNPVTRIMSGLQPSTAYTLVY